MPTPIADLSPASSRGGFFGTLRIEIGDDHPGTGFEVAFCDGMTYAAGRAGDYSNLAIELHGRSSSMFEIIVDDLAEPERQVGDDVGRGNDLPNR